MNTSSDESSSSSLGSSLSDSLPMNSLIFSQQEMIPQPEIIIDNNSNNNFINRINNQIPLNNPRNFSYSFSISIIFLLIINLSCLIHSCFNSFDQTDYSFTLWCIIQKEQYYRMITHHFFYLSLLHFTFTMIAFYYVSERLEKQIGTVYTFILIIQSMVTISLVYLLILLLVKIIRISSLDCNFWLQTGSTCLCLCLHQFYYLLKNNQDRTVDLLLFTIKAKHSTLVYIIILQIIVPKLSIIGHVCGYFTAHILQKVLLYISFPDKEWIKELENLVYLDRYYSIGNFVLYVPIDEFNEDNVDEINSFCKFKQGFNLIKDLIVSLSNKKANSNNISNCNENNNNGSRNNAHEMNSNGNSSNQHIEMVNEERLDNAT